MSVIQEAPPQPVAAPPKPDDRVVLHNVSWRFYEAFLAELTNRSVPRLTYDRGTLEIMSPSYMHEIYAALLAYLIEIMAEALAVRFKAAGHTTFRRQDLERGLEPDRCYYLTNVDRILGRTELDLSRDPPPDLALEIDWTRSSVDRQGIYAALGVPELWRFDGETLRVYLLRPDQSYEEVAQSGLFPALPLAAVPALLQRYVASDDLTVLRAFRAWVRQHVLKEGPASP